jgi:hypothetical protein
MEAVALRLSIFREHKSTGSPLRGDFTLRHKGRSVRVIGREMAFRSAMKAVSNRLNFDYQRIDPLGRLGASRPPAAGNGRTVNDVPDVI